MLYHLFRHVSHTCKILVISLTLFSALYAITALFAYESLVEFHIEQSQFLDVSNY